MPKNPPAQLEREIAEALSKKKTGRAATKSRRPAALKSTPTSAHHVTIHTKKPTWKQIAEDYKRTAKAAKAEGGKVKIYPYGAISILPVAGADEYYYEDWQADDLIDRTKRENGKVLDYISIEDLLLAQSQHW